MAATITDLMKLHDLVADELTRRVSSGTATPQDISNAVRLLRHNDIKGKREALARLAYALPEFPD